MGKTLQKYVLHEITAAFLGGLAVFTFVLLTARILHLIDLILARGVPPGRVLELFAYILPSFLELTIPMALLLGIVIAFGRLTGDGEVLAMHAAGVGLSQLLRPVIVFAAFVACLTFLLAVYARPWGNRKVDETVYEIAKTRATAALRPHMFNTGFGGMVIYVDRIDESGDLLEGIMLSDERDSYKRTTVFAAKGRLVTDEAAHSVYLQLLNGTSLAFQAAQESYDKTDFTSLEVRLDMDRQMAGLHRSSLEPRAMSWPDLLAARARRLAVGDPAVEENIEIQRKFVLSAAAFALAIIGVPLGVHRTRAVRARGLAVSISVILLYYFMLTGAVTVARRAGLSPAVLMWVPNLVLGGAGALLLGWSGREGGLAGLLRPGVKAARP